MADPQQARPPQDKAPPSKGRFAILIALIGSAATVVVVPTVQNWEGRELVPYRDIVGIWTDCDGNTKGVVPGQVQTEAQCDAKLEQQLVAHARPVLACTPEIADKPNILAASISLAYNIGPTAFCRSSARAAFRAHQWRKGCDAFLKWNRAGGQVVRGLDRRRRAERDICLRDVP